MPSSNATFPCGRSYAAARAKYVKKDDIVGAMYRVSAEEVEAETDSDEVNHSFGGTAAAAVGEERHLHRLLLTMSSMNDESLLALLQVVTLVWRRLNASAPAE